MSIIRKFKMGLIELFRKPTLAEIEANRRGQEIKERIDNAKALKKEVKEDPVGALIASHEKLKDALDESVKALNAMKGDKKAFMEQQNKIKEEITEIKDTATLIKNSAENGVLNEKQKSTMVLLASKNNEAVKSLAVIEKLIETATIAEDKIYKTVCELKIKANAVKLAIHDAELKMKFKNSVDNMKAATQFEAGTDIDLDEVALSVNRSYFTAEETLEEESTNIEDELDKVMREANTEKTLDEFMKSL